MILSNLIASDLRAVIKDVSFKIIVNMTEDSA